MGLICFLLETKKTVKNGSSRNGFLIFLWIPKKVSHYGLFSSSNSKYHEKCIETNKLPQDNFRF